MSRRRTFAAVALSVPLALAACSSAMMTPPPVSHAGAFVTTLGDDTLAIENYTRTATSITGDLLVRQPAIQVVHYTAQLGADGRPTVLSYSIARADNAFPKNALRGASFRVDGDTIRAEVQRDSVIRRNTPSKGGFPYFGNSHGMWELMAASARATGRDSSTVFLVPAGAANGTPAEFAWYASGDSARIWTAGAPTYYRFSNGEIQGADGRATPGKIIVHRVRPLDLGTYSNAFYAAQQAGHAYGVTTRDTVRATVAGASLWVDYGRPLKRGRQIYGGLVVLDSVWRTGANAATQFRSDRDLVIGGTAVPAGTYTLFTWPTANGMQLIVNRQVGQWGTVYDPKQDLARIPMQRATEATSTERFTIGVDAKDPGGVLKLTWDTTTYWVPFTVRQ
ncbi:MAG: hypothetical protein JWO05_731 [Gemmatimonadetes bacterium]|nr:hypothetical protein [Gemmatimonadota bacterium]